MEINKMTMYDSNECNSNKNFSLEITRNNEYEKFPKLNFDFSNFNVKDLRKLIMYISNNLSNSSENPTCVTGNKDKILLSLLSLELQKILKTIKIFIDNYYENSDGQGFFKLTQADWNLENLDAVDYIKNKPTEVSYFNNDAGYTNNIGTLTGIIMNGITFGTSGLIDLGNVITSHQDLSGKQDTLISGTNIKSVNGQSILGSGDIDTLDAIVDEETETLILQ